MNATEIACIVEGFRGLGAFSWSAEKLREQLLKEVETVQEKIRSLHEEIQKSEKEQLRLIKKIDSFQALPAKADAYYHVKRQINEKEEEISAIVRERHPIWCDVPELQEELEKRQFSYDYAKYTYDINCGKIVHSNYSDGWSIVPKLTVDGVEGSQDSAQLAKEGAALAQEFSGMIELKLVISKKRKKSQAAADLALKELRKQIDLLEIEKHKVGILYVCTSVWWAHDLEEFASQTMPLEQKLEMERKLQQSHPNQHNETTEKEAYEKGHADGTIACQESHKDLRREEYEYAESDLSLEWKAKLETETKAAYEQGESDAQKDPQRISATEKSREFQRGREAVLFLLGPAIENGLSNRSRAFEQARGSNPNKRIIEQGNRKAHYGDVLTDALLFDGQVTPHPRTDILAFSELYGFTSGFIKDNRTGACAVVAFMEFLNWRFSMKEFHHQNCSLGSFNATKFFTLWNDLFTKLKDAYKFDDSQAAITKCLQDRKSLFDELKKEYEVAEKKHIEHMKTRNLRRTPSSASVQSFNPGTGQMTRSASLDIPRAELGASNKEKKGVINRLKKKAFETFA